MGLVALVPRLVILGILGMIVRRTVSHSMVITASKYSSSQTLRRVTQQMGDEVTLTEKNNACVKKDFVMIFKIFKTRFKS